MADGQERMIEIVRRIMCHSDLLHDPARWRILRDGEGHQLGNLQLFERVGGDSARAFCRQAAIPKLWSKTPADLNARREVRLKPRHRKPDEAKKSLRFAQLDRVKSPAALLDRAIDAGRQIVAFCARKSCRKKAHCMRIGIEARERLAISGVPAAKKEPRSCNHRVCRKCVSQSHSIPLEKYERPREDRLKCVEIKCGVLIFAESVRLTLRNRSLKYYEDFS